MGRLEVFTDNEIYSIKRTFMAATQAMSTPRFKEQKENYYDLLKEFVEEDRKRIDRKVKR